MLSRALDGSEKTLVWVLDRGRNRGHEYYDSMQKPDQAKFRALARRMASRGKIRDETKFRHEGDQIYVFKIHGHRFACFMDEHLVLITHGYPKQGDDRPPGEFERAQRIRHQYYEWKRNR